LVFFWPLNTRPHAGVIAYRKCRKSDPLLAMPKWADWRSSANPRTATAPSVWEVRPCSSANQAGRVWSVRAVTRRSADPAQFPNPAVGSVGPLRLDFVGVVRRQLPPYAHHKRTVCSVSALCQIYVGSNAAIGDYRSPVPKGALRCTTTVAKSTRPT
jgi:hypothetical protein